ncbi:MAG TPA: hypothetical protein VK445_02275 [Dissulfurispiraceae bacterium]|nr:hypothetical protein [Dissulfurispiraceae bacterium]
MSDKMSYEEFIKKAIVNLRKDNYKGIHTVYSGFNQAFKKHYGDVDPITVTNDLAAQGKIVVRPVRGGVMLYLPEDAPQIQSKGNEALAAILGPAGIEGPKLSFEDFIKAAIVKLRKDNYKGIHTVYSGFNQAFKKYFEGADPIKVTNELAAQGKIVVRPVRGGVMLYLTEEAPRTQDKGEEALGKILGS